MVGVHGRQRLGRTGVEVSPLGFGAAALGNLYAPVSDEDAQAAVDAAWDAGIRYFDTAPHYGLGLSERRLGTALAGRPREEFVVSTKVGRLLVENPHPTGSDMAHQFAVPDALTRVRDYSADGVRRSLEASLERLGLDRVDVVLVHDPDDVLDQAVDESVPALVALRDEGLVGAVGVGMNQWQALRRFVVETDVDVIMVAGRWTLVDRCAEPLMTAAQERSVSVLAAAAYNSGLLAAPWPADDALFDYGPAPAEVLAIARAWAARAEQHGVTLPDLALQFPLRHPATAAVVVGLRSPAEVAAAAERLARSVPEAVWAEPTP